MRLLTGLLLFALPVLVLACSGDDDNGDATPTSQPPTIEAPTEAPESPTATSESEATPTSEPEATDTPVPTATAESTATPDPGSTEPFVFDTVPEAPSGIFTLTDVRIGAHPEDGFDRIVFEFEPLDGDNSAHPGGRVDYVEEAFHCGSGAPSEIDAPALLVVRFDLTQAHNEQGELTIDATEIDGPGDAITEAASFCDFEGLVQWGIGVAEGEQPYTATFLEDPARLVIDIRSP